MRLARRLLAAALLSAACQGSGPRPAPALSSSAEAAPGPAADSSGRFDLVYERTVGGDQDIYVLPGGGLERRLTDHPGHDALPRWSRNGRAVFFTSDRSGNWQIYRARLEGGPPVRVRTNQTTDWQQEQSPDGTTLAFLSKQEGPEYLFLMDLGSRRERVLVRHGNQTVMGNPSWSPDGRRLVFSSNWKLGHQIYVVDAAGGEARRITSFRAGGCEPRFHPDGRRVVYVRRGFQADKSRLVTQDLETGQETALVEWPALNYDPAFSPDGTELAFASNITGEFALYRQRFADGRSWRVTFGKGPARYPDYRPAAARP